MGTGSLEEYQGNSPNLATSKSCDYIKLFVLSLSLILSHINLYSIACDDLTISIFTAMCRITICAGRSRHQAPSPSSRRKGDQSLVFTITTSPYKRFA